MNGGEELMTVTEWTSIAAGPVPIRYGAHEIEWAQHIVQSREDICVPYTAPVFCALYEAVATAYDSWRYTERETCAERDRATQLRDQKMTKANTTELLEAGESMVDVPAILGFASYETYLLHLLGQNAQRSALSDWTDLDWLRWEAFIRKQGPISANACCTAMDKPRSLIGNFKLLLSLYNHPVGRQRWTAPTDNPDARIIRRREVQRAAYHARVAAADRIALRARWRVEKARAAESAASSPKDGVD